MKVQEALKPILGNVGPTPSQSTGRASTPLVGLPLAIVTESIVTLVTFFRTNICFLWQVPKKTTWNWKLSMTFLQDLSTKQLKLKMLIGLRYPKLRCGPALRRPPKQTKTDWTNNSNTDWDDLSARTTLQRRKKTAFSRSQHFSCRFLLGGNHWKSCPTQFTEALGPAYRNRRTGLLVSANKMLGFIGVSDRWSWGLSCCEIGDWRT